MRVAVIGSRGLSVPSLAPFLPAGTSVIVSGGARGVDSSARAYALAHGLELVEFLPQYSLFGRSAPLVRNRSIVAACDLVLAFWDGSSRGTAYVIRHCREMGVPFKVFRPSA